MTEKWESFHIHLQNMGIAYSKMGYEVSFRAIGRSQIVVRFEDGKQSVIDLDDGFTYDTVTSSYEKRAW